MAEPYPCELKTFGELIDRLTIVNIKVWHLVDIDRAGDHSVAPQIGALNEERHQIVRALNRRFGDRDIGQKVYAHDPSQ